ncbi:Retinol dehydrogenase 14 [Camponotus japonicus]
MIDSEIWLNVPAPLSWLMYLITETFFKTPVQGAQTTIHLAVSNEFNNISGKYLMDCAEHGLSNAVNDPVKGKKLCKVSEPLVKLQSSDPKI